MVWLRDRQAHALALPPRSAQQDNQNAGLLQVCFYVCAQMLYSLIAYLTKFATVMMAISGEAFLTAGGWMAELPFAQQQDILIFPI